MSGRTTHQGIVVGVDGSSSSTVALRWAAREAMIRNVPLTLVHAHGLTPVGSAVAWPAGPVSDEVRQWQEDHARKIIADAIKVVEDDADRGEHPEINSELSAAAPIPTLVDLSKEA